MSRPRAWIAVAALAAMACSKRPSEPPRSQDTAQNNAKVQAPAVDPLLAGAHGSRKLRGIEAPVYVDGIQTGVLRYGELPPIANVGSDVAPEYRLADYLKAIGVAPERIKAIHLHDGADRIGSLEGAELAKDPARFRVHFTSGDSGAAEARWDTVGLKSRFIVHEIKKLSVYVTKPVPAIKKGDQCHLGEGGVCTDQVPYAQGGPMKGTRVYVDGALVGFVKRKLLPDSLIVGGKGDDHEYSLAKLAASFGADIKDVAQVDLVSGDEVIGRADRARWANHQGEMYFTLPAHQHGKVRVHVPADLQADDAKGREDKDALVTAVHFYKRTTPSSHSLVAITEETELHAQIASNDQAPNDEGTGQGR